MKILYLITQPMLSGGCDGETVSYDKKYLTYISRYYERFSQWMVVSIWLIATYIVSVAN